MQWTTIYMSSMQREEGELVLFTRSLAHCGCSLLTRWTTASVSLTKLYLFLYPPHCCNSCCCTIVLPSKKKTCTVVRHVCELSATTSTCSSSHIYIPIASAKLKQSQFNFMELNLNIGGTLFDQCVGLAQAHPPI